MIICDGNELGTYLLAEVALDRCSPKVALQVIETTLRDGFFPVNLLYTFRTPFP